MGQYRHHSPTSGGAIGVAVGGGGQYRQPSSYEWWRYRGGEGVNIRNIPLRVVALSGGGGGQYRHHSPTSGDAIGVAEGGSIYATFPTSGGAIGEGEGVNIGNLPLRVVVLSRTIGEYR